MFDRIIAEATVGGVYSTPWEPDGTTTPQYKPDYETLKRLLGVPLQLGAKPVSGVPALALDVWTAYELRRAGFEPDRVWPRPVAPRIVPWTLLQILRNGSAQERQALRQLLGSAKTYGGALSASANILGKNYVKQVDVVMSAWDTGPELMISTKRMDSSFGKNAANRVEESYGDAKNLRSRHPQAALGFLYGLNALALKAEPEKARWLIDLLGKLGREDDAYDAVGLLLPSTRTDGDKHSDGASSTLALDEDDSLEEAEVAAAEADEAGVASAPMYSDEITRRLDALPEVDLQVDRVPDNLQLDRFLTVMVGRVLDNCPIDFHPEARRRRGAAVDLV